MPIVPISERVAVVEQKLDNHDEKLEKLDQTIQTLNQTLLETNKTLTKIQLTNAFLSGQRKGVYATLCAASSAVGAGLSLFVEHILSKGHP